MALVYRRPGLVLRRSSGSADPLVKALQRDLRRLGYLRSGIDGQFGGERARRPSAAVRSAQRHRARQ
jgi:peptidoglycan hydrolase-like protein with peptidoglycan-binding domain